jgi:hypothetical protein
MSRTEHSWRVDQRRPIGEAVADFRHGAIEAPPVDRIALGLALSGELCLFAHRCMPFLASSAPSSCARLIVGRQRFGLVLTFTVLGPDATTRSIEREGVGLVAFRRVAVVWGVWYAVETQAILLPSLGKNRVHALDQRQHLNPRNAVLGFKLTWRTH